MKRGLRLLIRWAMPLFVGGAFYFVGAVAWARRVRDVGPDPTTGLASNPLNLIFTIGALALLPFLLMMITSFVKIAVVLSIVRSALGTQQNPPTQVITGLAVILTVYVMAPVGVEIYQNISPLLKEWKRIGTKGRGKKGDLLDPAFVDLVQKIVAGASDPMRRFLKTHSHVKERNMFYTIALQLQSAQEERRRSEGKSVKSIQRKISMDDFLILIPSFVISELKKAFQIGFLIFLPFLVVDMVVANILLALGMHMLSPTTISLPFKLLLFVLVDGWYLIAKGLVLGYV